MYVCMNIHIHIYTTHIGQPTLRRIPHIAIPDVFIHTHYTSHFYMHHTNTPYTCLLALFLLFWYIHITHVTSTCTIQLHHTRAFSHAQQRIHHTHTQSTLSSVPLNSLFPSFRGQDTIYSILQGHVLDKQPELITDETAQTDLP
jgi:hypothetical protein